MLSDDGKRYHSGKGRDAEIAAAEAERKAMNLGLKAVETGAKVAWSNS